jgi:hypothetical protein
MRNMKRHVLSALVAAGLVLASAGTANAQLVTTMKFTTNFPFMVGSRSMPAGAYTVRPMEADHSLMEISNGHSSVWLLTEKDIPKVQPRQDEVIFTRRGDTYVLQEIWDASSSMGAEAIPVHAAHASHDAKAR